ILLTRPLFHYLVSIRKYNNLLPLVEDPEPVAGTGEDKGGGDEIIGILTTYCFPLPVQPRTWVTYVPGSDPS
ncbi:MAG: hypothetical protein OEV22_15615, partial [Deltaproteobacteria bacterium]|nr:hypothetical protein [Deltaproteobacteria bacterium]